MTELDIPDITGEIWRKAVETSELPSRWMRRLESAFGAMLFVRGTVREATPTRPGLGHEPRTDENTRVEAKKRS